MGLNTQHKDAKLPSLAKINCVDFNFLYYEVFVQYTNGSFFYYFNGNPFEKDTYYIVWTGTRWLTIART